MSDINMKSLFDREAIRDCLMRYARAIDRCDRKLLESVYWPEATDHHGNYQGGVQGFIDWVVPLLESMDQTTHMLGNILIKLEQNSAAVETYFNAYHRIRPADGDPYDVVITGRYLDRMAERGGEWRILARVVVYDWFRIHPDSGSWKEGVLGLQFRSHRRPDDSSYALFP